MPGAVLNDQSGKAQSPVRPLFFPDQRPVAMKSPASVMRFACGSASSVAHQLLGGMALAALLVSGGCDSAGRTTDAPSPSVLLSSQPLKADSVTLSQIDAGRYANLVAGTTAVLRTQEGYEALWADLHADRRTVPDLPPIDFSAQMVVAIVLGERPTGGYRVSVEEVRARTDAAQLRVAYTESQPGEGCAVVQVRTAPYVLVAVDRPEDISALEEAVSFVRTVETRPC